MMFTLFYYLIANENYNVSPLHFACEKSIPEIIRALLKNRADPNVVRIPLIIVAVHGDGVLSNEYFCLMKHHFLFH